MARLGPLLETLTPGSSGKGNGLLASASGRRLVSMGRDGVGRFLYSLGKVGYLYVPLLCDTVKDGKVSRKIYQRFGGSDDTDQTTTEDYLYGVSARFEGNVEPIPYDYKPFDEAKGDALSYFSELASACSGTAWPYLGTMLSVGKVALHLISGKNLYEDGIGRVDSFCEARMELSKNVAAFSDNFRKSASAEASFYYVFSGEPMFFLFASCATGAKVSLPIRLYVSILATKGVGNLKEGIALSIPSLTLKAFSANGAWDNYTDDPFSSASTVSHQVPVNIVHTASTRRVYHSVDAEVTVNVPRSRLVALAWDEQALEKVIRPAFDNVQGYETSEDERRDFRLSADINVDIGMDSTMVPLGVVHPVA